MREARTQFGVLYRVFLMRVVDLELLSADADTTRLVGQFATVFASVSLMFTLPVIFIGLSQERGLGSMRTPEHFFTEVCTLRTDLL